MIRAQCSVVGKGPEGPKANITQHFLGAQLCVRLQGEAATAFGQNVTVLELKVFYAEIIHKRHKTMPRPCGLRDIDSKHSGNEEEGTDDNDHNTNQQLSIILISWSSPCAYTMALKSLCERGQEGQQPRRVPWASSNPPTRSYKAQRWFPPLYGDSLESCERSPGKGSL